MIAAFSKARAALVITTLVILSLAAHLIFRRPNVPKWGTYHRPIHDVVIPPSKLPCRNLPPTDKIVIVMRTGATEIEDKLSVHFSTTFLCYADIVVFSDLEETFHDYPVHDVFKNMDPAVKESNADFEIYRRLQQDGREGLRPEELSGQASFEGSKSGKTNNPGWALDKWKFLPMMREALNIRPETAWYVFVESDSYVVWSNLLQWLSNIDYWQPWYFGSENQIGKDIYAHGGSVFVLSRPAVRQVVELYTENEEKWHRKTDEHWAGDCILGMALLEAGVPLTWSWPMFQGGQPEKMDFSETKGPDKKLWCTPAMSYHHFSAPELERMWHFEQNWIRSRLKAAATENRVAFQNDKLDVLHHREVFRRFILPNITTEWWEWNNLSPDLIVANDDFDACRHLCEESPDCLQFSVGPPGCSISTQSPIMGERWRDYKSYWSSDRIDRWMTSMDECDGLDGWLVPPPPS